MDFESSRKRKLAIAAISIIAANEILDDGPPKQPRLTEEEDNRVNGHLLQHMQNNAMFRDHAEPPQFPLVTRLTVEELYRDPARNEIKLFSSLYLWEFNELAEFLRPFIERSRSNHTRPQGNRMKKNYRNRLFYTLYWLTQLSEFRVMEAWFGWAKTSIEKDVEHVLYAIIEGLDYAIQWPDNEERAHIASQYSGLLANVIVILDANEVPIEKPKDPDREQATFSGKARTNTKKYLMVIDRNGFIRRLVGDTDGGINVTVSTLHIVPLCSDALGM